MLQKPTKGKMTMLRMSAITQSNIFNFEFEKLTLRYQMLYQHHTTD